MGIFGRKRKQRAGDDRLLAVGQDQLGEWIEGIADEVEALYPGDPSPEMTMALSRASEYSIYELTPVMQHESDIAMSIALTGYLFREREMDILDDHDSAALRERFAELRGDFPEWDSWLEAAIESASMAAWGDGREGAVVLPVQTVGEDGRRMAAQMFVGGMGPPPDAIGLAVDEDYMRAWRFGWYLRCFEAAIPAE